MTGEVSRTMEIEDNPSEADLCWTVFDASCWFSGKDRGLVLRCWAALGVWDHISQCLTTSLKKFLNTEFFHPKGRKLMDEPDSSYWLCFLIKGTFYFPPCQEETTVMALHVITCMFDRKLWCTSCVSLVIIWSTAVFQGIKQDKFYITEKVLKVWVTQTAAEENTKALLPQYWWHAGQTSTVMLVFTHPCMGMSQILSQSTIIFILTSKSCN